MSILLSFSNEQIGQFLVIVLAALFVPTAFAQMGGAEKLRSLLAKARPKDTAKSKAPPSIRRDKSAVAAAAPSKRDAESGFGRR